jgi:hypothetical protein
MVLIVRSNLRQLGVFFALITALLFIVSLLSVNLGMIIRHKLRARELRRLKDIGNENETSPTVCSPSDLLRYCRSKGVISCPLIVPQKLLASPRVNGAYSPTGESSQPPPAPHKRDLHVKIDAAIRRAEAAATEARRRQAQRDNDSADFTLTSPTALQLPRNILGSTPLAPLAQMTTNGETFRWQPWMRTGWL